MNLDRGILRTDICSDGLSTRTDEPNTLTCQPDGTNNAPRHRLHRPVTEVDLEKFQVSGARILRYIIL